MAAKKLFYKIGEACKQLDIQPYVLRYWETEFPALAPSKSRSGQRVYSDEDLRVIHRIKELLYEEGFTIAGAKKRLESELAGGGPKTRPQPAPGRGGGKPAAPATVAAAPTPPAAAPAGGGTDESERLRAGLERALDQARSLLSLLTPPASQG